MEQRHAAGPPPLTRIPIAHRLMAACAEWATIGGEYLLRQGIRAEWRESASPSRLRRSLHFTIFAPHGKEQNAYTHLLMEELQEGIVVEVPREEVAYLNPTFLVPKRGGKFRKVMDCRGLNLELRDTHFKMEGVEVAQALMQQGDWATSLDFKSAFSHVPVHEDLRPFLCFQYGGKTFQYRGMPFGVKHAPRVFTRLMKRAVTAVRERWRARMTFYMDDSLLLFPDKETAEQQTREIATFFMDLGWTLSEEKCQYTPTQQIEFLGWKWDLRTYTVCMAEEKRHGLMSQLTGWIRLAEMRARTPVRNLASLIGRLNFLRLQFPDASLHLKELDDLKVRTVQKGGWDSVCTVTPQLSGNLKWWAAAVNDNSPRSLYRPPVTATLTTDASPVGWGAVLQQGGQEQYTYGTWREGLAWTSNARELSAVRLALQRFKTELRLHPNTSLLVRSDNTTTVSDINSLRAPKSLLTHLLRLLSVARALRISLTALHIPGVQNQAADRLSRMGMEREYTLSQTARQAVMEEFQFHPTVDVFVTGTDWAVDQGLERLSDSLRIAWTGRDLYIHPPINLLMATVIKLRTEPARAILIHPAWEGQPWSILIREGARRQKDLGTFDEVMDTTLRFRSEGWRLPPGNVMASLMDTRMIVDNSTSSNS
jgi:ribonuclease HI